MEIINDTLKCVDENDIIDGEIIIPDNVKVIAKGAFSKIVVNKVVFPKNLVKIENNAFIVSTIGEIIFQNSQVKIAKNAFTWGNNLSEYTLQVIKKLREQSNAKNLELLENFFTLDTEVKQKLYQAGNIPTNQDEIISYTDNLLKIVKNIENKLINICDLYNIESAFPIIKSLTNKCQNRIQNTNYTFRDLQTIYNDYFAKMTTDTINLIHSNIYGYSYLSKEELEEILKKCSSFNELLHALHQYVTKNDNILGDINEIKSMQIEEDTTIFLRGDDNPLTEKIYETIVRQSLEVPNEYKNHMVGDTDIIALNKSQKILIMVRDKGHSLTIEAKLHPDGTIGVEYYMPKTISYEITSKLKGINNYHKKDEFATGSFLTDTQNFTTEIVDLINAVPTDFNIFESTETMYSYLENKGKKI